MKNAYEIAKSLPVIPGQTLKMPVSVILEWMHRNDLVFGGYKDECGRPVVCRAEEAKMAKKSLEEILSFLLDKSLRTHSAARLTLGGGLELSVWDVRDGRILLQLARVDVYPSMGEWETVLRKFPERVQGSDPKQFVYKGRYFLKGELRRSE